MNLLISVLLPLLALPFIIGFGERLRNLRELSILCVATLLFLNNVDIYQQFVAGQSQDSGSFEILSGLGIGLSAEPIGVVFALLASFLWIVTTIYSIGYMRGHHEKNQTRFYACFAISLSAVMAAAYASDLLTLFIAYEVITLATFPLVTHSGTEAAKRSGRIYLGMLMGGSIVLLLPAMIAIWWVAGSLSFTSGGLALGSLSPVWIAILLALIVFGTGKAALMPFHSWLPNAMVAPTPVSALLHAVAVVKTGVFLILKVVVYIFGFDLIEQTNASQLLQIVAAATILIASAIAMTKDNLKARLAYSTVSQLAYIVLAAMLANEIAATGAGLHIVSHAFGKITLFFCAGAILVASHKTLISELDGIGRQMPYTMAAFFIAALSIIGLPPLAGMWSKLAIAQGALTADQWWLVVVLMVSSLLNIAYLLPIPIRAFFGGQGGHIDAKPLKEAPWPCLVAIAVTSTGCIAFFFMPGSLVNLLALIAE